MKNAALIGWRVFVVLSILGMIRCIVITEDQVFMNEAKIDLMYHTIGEIRSDVLYIRENQESDRGKDVTSESTANRRRTGVTPWYRQTCLRVSALSVVPPP